MDSKQGKEQQEGIQEKDRSLKVTHTWENILVRRKMKIVMRKNGSRFFFSGVFK